MTETKVDQAYVCFDCETTGLDGKTDRLIELGAVRFTLAKDGEVTNFSQLANPGIPIPLPVVRLTGITDDDVADSPSGSDIVESFKEFSKDAIFIGHSAAFDVGFVEREDPRFFDGATVLDTLDMARLLLPRQPSHGLEALGQAFHLYHDRPHRAHSDAEATRQLFLTLIDAAKNLPSLVLESLREWAPLSESAGLSHILNASLTGKGTSEPAIVMLEGVKDMPRPTIRLHVDKESQGTPVAEPALAALESETVALLGPDGPIAQAPGREFRPVQEQMGRAVAQTIERRGRVLIEAGAGTGKSFAYLVPVALAASQNRRAVIATNTVALQDQLAQRDIPALAELLNMPIAAASLKGRGHYISLRRWERFARERRMTVDDARFAIKVAVWLVESTAGERGELHLTLGESHWWSAVESTVDDCLGKRCANWNSGRCAMVAARNTARGSPIVVTNHAMVLADGNGRENAATTLGRYEILVIDEAHRFEEAATSAAEMVITGDEFSFMGHHLPLAQDATKAMAHASAAVFRLVRSVKGFLTSRQGGTHSNVRVLLTEDIRHEPAFLSVSRVAADCIVAADALADALGVTANELFEEGWAKEDEGILVAEADLIAGAAQRLSAGIIQMFVDAPADIAVWCELRGEKATLHAAPIDVSTLIREGVVGNAQSAILTSATLGVHGSFEYVRRRLGLQDGCDELTLSSPFDFLTQSLLVLPTDMPRPDHADYHEALARVVLEAARARHGRTLALFTGYAALRSVHARISDELEKEGIATLGQGIDGTRSQMVRSFEKDGASVLLGTMSLWEGIDIPGDALECVIVAKLPFPVPDEPLLKARSALTRDAFGQLSVPRAILTLRQGFGRLIRRSTDRGVVILCDERLLSRNYGKTFLESLPPAEMVQCRVDEVGEVVTGRLGDLCK